MHKRIFFIVIAFCFAANLALAGNCPPGSLVVNPSPVVVGGGAEKCIIEASWVELNLNQAWSRNVKLKAGSYWFSASKCARGRMLSAEVKDKNNNIIKSDSGSKIGFCFTVPVDGKYKISYKVIELNSSYSYAITSACLSHSSCTP